MRGILYLIAVVVSIGWLIGITILLLSVIMYSISGLVYILVVLAIISLLLGFIRSGSDA